MEIFENYITILATIICIRSILSFIYVPIMRRTSAATKGRKFLPTRMFGWSSKNSFYGFWLSIIWLITYYFDFINGFIRGLLNG